MRRSLVVAALLVLSVAVLPTAPASAQTVLTTGTFVGTVDMDCGDPSLPRIACSVNIHSVICVEVAAGTDLGGSCDVTISGFVTGVGVREICLAFDTSAGGSVTSFNGTGYSHDGPMTHNGTVGEYEGTGDAGATAVAVEAAWNATGCRTDIVGGLVEGSFVTTLSP